MAKMTSAQRDKIERATKAAIEAIVNSLDRDDLQRNDETYNIMMTAAIRVMCSMAVGDPMHRWPQHHLLSAVNYYYGFFENALPQHLADQQKDQVKH